MEIKGNDEEPLVVKQEMSEDKDNHLNGDSKEKS